jgi:hypothetical protein
VAFDFRCTHCKLDLNEQDIPKKDSVGRELCPTCWRPVNETDARLEKMKQNAVRSRIDEALKSLGMDWDRLSQVMRDQLWSAVESIVKRAQTLGREAPAVTIQRGGQGRITVGFPADAFEGWSAGEMRAFGLEKTVPQEIPDEAVVQGGKFHYASETA